MIRNKINHLMPTTSPAPKQGAKIESVTQALKVYASKGVRQVVLQPKYMGSYCDLYLFRDHDQSYFVSRGGHKITHKDEAAMREASASLQERVYARFPTATLIVVAAEMLPWSYLGEGLIEREFGAYAKAQHILLGEYHVSPFSGHQKVKDFQRDWALLSTDELRENYPHFIRKYCRAVSNMPNIGKLMIGQMNFEEQLALFGQDAPLEFKPFQIMKIERGDEVELPEMDTYSRVSNDRSLIISSSQYEEAEDFFSLHRTEQWEGIVVKPLLKTIEGAPSSIKVRTSSYLHLIYGNDFGYNFDIYYRKRRIKRKMALHLKELEISRKLLAIPRSQITLENKEYRKLVYEFFNFLNKEEELDNTL